MKTVIVFVIVSFILCGCGAETSSQDEIAALQEQIKEVQQQIDDATSQIKELQAMQDNALSNASASMDESISDSNSEYSTDDVERMFFNYLKVNGYEVTLDQIEASFMDGDIWVDAYYAPSPDSDHASPIAHGRVEPSTGEGVFWSILTDNDEIAIDYKEYDY